ncbi:hypothetical protein ACTL6U_05770 [Rhodovibrionaceae bacterium A322]
MNWIANLPLFLYLATIPLVSMGASSGQAALTWLGLLSVLSASLITPALKFRENVREPGASTEFDHKAGEDK